MKEYSELFNKGERFDNENFSGAVYLNMIAGKDMGLPIANVTFEPGCINSWHKHKAGQILLVTSGRGWYVEEGSEPIELNSGDVVEIKAGVKHYHGAAKDSWFSHLAIEINPEKGPATWLEPVDRSEYDKLK